MDGVRCRLIFLSLARKPKPHAPPLNKSCSATRKDVKAISLSANFILFAAVSKNALLKRLFQVFMPALFLCRPLFTKACSSPRTLIIFILTLKMNVLFHAPQFIISVIQPILSRNGGSHSLSACWPITAKLIR